MGRGYLAGTAWGVLVGGLVVALASQVTERRDLVTAASGSTEIEPQVIAEDIAEAPEVSPPVPVPVGAPDPAAGPATVAVAEAPDRATEGEDTPAATPAPVAEAPAPEAGTAPTVVAPSVEALPETVGAASVAAGARQRPSARPAEPVPAVADAPPQVGAPSPLALAEPSAPAAPPTALSQPAAPAAAGDALARAPADPAVVDGAPRPLAPGAAGAPPVVATDAAASPSASPAPVQVPPPADIALAPAPAPATGTVAGAPPDRLPVVGDEQVAPEAAEPPAPGVERAARVRVNRLPTIGGDAVEAAPEAAPMAEATEAPGASAPRPGFQNAAGVRVNRLPTIGAGTAAAAPEETGAAETALREPALVRHAVAFDNPDGAPLLAIILLHGSAAAPGTETGLDLPMPVSFAVDAGQEGARAVAAAYRAAGREVLLVPTIPQGATPSDVEVALGVNLDTVPEAVALMDAPEGGFQFERAAVAQIVAAVSDTGHGLVTYPRGVNTALQLADREGVPVGTVFRVLEPGNTDAVLRSLDQAAFRARQEGGVILVGQAEPATVAALRRWVGANPNRQVAFAPVSAALAAP